MNSTIKCVSCGLEKDVSEYNNGSKRTCSACKMRKHEQAVSGSYEAYLRNLYAKSKSKVKSGERGSHVDFNLEPDDLLKLWEKQEGRCAISGVVLTHHKDGSGVKDFNASIDRINNDRGYSPDNIQLVCFRVNIMKHTLSADMLYWWIRTINDFSCNDNIS